MKNKKLLTLSLSLLLLASCGANEPSVIVKNEAEDTSSSEVTSSYAITVVQGDKVYLEGLPSEGVAGTTYTFSVSLKRGYHFNDKVTISTVDEATQVQVNEVEGKYSFTMPSAAIKVELDIGETDFTINYQDVPFVEAVYLEDNDSDGNLVSVHSAVAGTNLKFKAEESEDYSFSYIKLNGETITKGDDGFYHFTMPKKPVTLSSDVTKRAYNITLSSTLTLSTLTMYTDVENKTSITSATKDDVVYLKFNYNEGIKAVSYSITAKYGTSYYDKLDVTQDTSDTSLYYFTMVSKEITLTVTETDRTAYYDSPLLNNDYKTMSVSSSDSDSVESKSYSDLSYNTYSFTVDGNCKKNTSSYTWEVDKDNLFWINSYSTYYYKGYATKHLFMLSSSTNYKSSTSFTFNGCEIGLANDDYDLHYMGFGSKAYRLFWIQDSEGHIIESIFVLNKSSVYVNVSLKDEDGNEVLGDNVNLTSKFTIYSSSGAELTSVDNGTASDFYQFNEVKDDFVDITYTDENGNAIKSAKSGATVKFKPTLNESTPEGYEITSVKATYVIKSTSYYGSDTTKDLTLTTNDDGSYSFTMPSYNVTITVVAKNNSLYKDYAGLGDYYTFNMCSSGISTKNYSSSSGWTQRFSILPSGEIEKYSSSGSLSTTYTIKEFTNANEGSITYLDSSTECVGWFGDEMLVVPYSGSQTSYLKYGDVYIGMRASSTDELNDVKLTYHYIGSSSNYSSVTWTAIASKGSGDNMTTHAMFNYHTTIYTNVTVTYDEGTTEIGTTASYHIVKNGVTLFDINNGTVTPHVND